MHGITKAYFDKTIKNNFGSFTSTNDLYHVGASPLNEFVTIESFLTNFNNSYGTSLPVFMAGTIGRRCLMAPWPAVIHWSCAAMAPLLLM
mgnify:CR=1 FL=1